MTAVPCQGVRQGAPPKAYDDFCAMDPRIATIIQATRVEGSHQNLCHITMEVEGWGLGVAMSKIPGIDPASLAGKRVLVLCNVKSRVIAGVATTVLLVTTRTPDQKHSSLIVPDDPAIASGCLVR